MTEQEWLQATDPEPMLDFLRGRAGERELRLFACACCRRVWHLMTDDRSQRAVELAERVADRLDRLAGKSNYAVRRAARQVGENARRNDTRAAGRAAAGALEGKIKDFSPNIGWSAAEASAWNAARQMDPDYTDPAKADKAWDAAFAAERSLQCRLLHCIIGNPFCPILPIMLDPAWLTWHDGLPVSMAQKMYDRRDFSDMPVLADALEEAGCQDQDILAHCRSGGEHVRGCWVIDALLGKS